MQNTLRSRIDRLERDVPKQEPTGPEVKHVDLDATMARLAAVLMDEPPERKEILTLEERLAIARREALPEPEVWADRWDPQLGRLRYQRIPATNRGAANTARELEIMILQRDGKITPPEATRLRGGRLDLELPFPVVIENEDAVADEALRRCPPFASLPLEEQLRRKELELQQWRQEAATCDGASFGSLKANFGFDHEEQFIAKLKQNIAERDRASECAQRDGTCDA